MAERYDATYAFGYAFAHFTRPFDNTFANFGCSLYSALGYCPGAFDNLSLTDDLSSATDNALTYSTNAFRSSLAYFTGSLNSTDNRARACAGASVIACALGKLNHISVIRYLW